MRVVEVKDYRNAIAVLNAGSGTADWARGIFDASDVDFGRRRVADLHARINDSLVSCGWSGEVQLHSDYQLTIRSLRERFAFHVQITGNASRLAYDLLKLQYLNSISRIDAAVYALPTTECARQIGQNLASYDRAARELDLFATIITCPIMLIGYSN